MIGKLNFLLLALALSAAAQTQSPQAPAAATTLEGKAITDRPDALYTPGETVRFTITATLDGKPAEGPLKCFFSKDGVEPKREETVMLREGKAKVTGTLNEAGFLQMRAMLPDGKTSVLAAAGFNPEKLQPSMPVPNDFDTFWAAQKKALAEVKMETKLTPVKSPFAKVDAFDTQVTCLGAPVSGYYGRPKDAKPKSCPAILFVHGAGVGDSTLNALAWSEREGGMLSMDINAHGLPNGKPKAFYEEQAAGALKDYRFQGRDDREKNYFKGMFLRVIRAIDFMTAQPEWDGKTLIVYGSSQGGFQAFAAAGLDPRVTYFCAGVPAGCDHTGIQVGRINGWPKLVTITDGKPAPAELECARYFDNVNFATRARCKGAAVTVGFIDFTCPPSSVYAAYNALSIPKKILNMPLTGHKSSPEAVQYLTEAALAHVREMRK